ncbi:uncharacterized protein LOC135819423 [Sycon ciliatum]|uniref:uncharacterized protein LOC135819423 n=1 Tax=Sycon ciliatum TaxID=27933 RepID=UPI0031F616CB
MQSCDRNLIIVAFLCLFAATARAFECRDGSQGEEDCALNGFCHSTRCVCDPGWTGERCNFLDLLAPNRSEPHGYYNGTMPTWGGDVIFENGLYHLFVTAKGYTQPPLDQSDNYECNTAIVRLEGPGPAGPYKFAQVALPVYHHEAHAIRAPDGTLLIYMIKFDGGDLPPQLSNETCLAPGCHVYNFSHQATAMAWSDSVYGPWREKVVLNPWPGPADRYSWLCQTNCPSVAFAQNGSVVMALRAVQCNQPPDRANWTYEKIAIATAPHWTGPYTIVSKEPIFGYEVPADWPPELVTPGQPMRNEDPFIWRTHRGYHMLVHSQLLPHSRSRGAYAFSRDGLDWTLLPEFSWQVNMTWADGDVSFFQRRQAPGLYLDKDGFPLYLLTPVDELYSDGCHWGRGWTLMQPVKRTAMHFVT